MSWIHAENTGLTASMMNRNISYETRKWEAKSRASRQACVIKPIIGSTQILQLQQPLSPGRCHVFWAGVSTPWQLWFLLLHLATKIPFRLMTNQNQTSPDPHPQNQPPDSGSVHEPQRQQLRLSLHRSHSLEILPREHISGHLKILGRFCTRFCSIKSKTKSCWENLG